MNNNKKISTHCSHALSIVIVLNTILVVLRHTVNLHHYYKNGNPWMSPIDLNVLFQIFMARLTSVAIPFFFLVSGYLFFYNIDQINDCLSKIKKRFSTLLIPYWIWNALLILFCLVLSVIPALKDQICKTFALEYSISWIIAKLTYDPIIGQFWYIRTLFIFILFSPLYLYAFKSKICFIPIILLTIVLWQPSYTTVLSSEGACFFLIGGYLSYHASLPSQQSCKYWIWFLLLQLIIFPILIFTTIRNAFIHLFIQKICILAQLYSGWQICLYLATQNKICHFLENLNHHSFFIYATHATILKALSLFFSRLFPHTSYFSFISYIACFVTTLIVSILLSSFIRKISPQIYSTLTGGR